MVMWNCRACVSSIATHGIPLDARPSSDLWFDFVRWKSSNSDPESHSQLRAGSTKCWLGSNGAGPFWDSFAQIWSKLDCVGATGRSKIHLFVLGEGKSARRGLGGASAHSAGAHAAPPI